MRLIDAEALIESFYKKISKEEVQYTQPFIAASLRLLGKFIDHAPTIEAKPVVHAHWEETGTVLGKCSNCGGMCPKIEYCGRCGAIMDEK